jgi:hypothetical protein
MSFLREQGPPHLREVRHDHVLADFGAGRSSMEVAGIDPLASVAAINNPKLAKARARYGQNFNIVIDSLYIRNMTNKKGYRKVID